MKIINWNKPKKARPSSEHNQITFDGGPPGAFIPNMSGEDARQWRGKLIKGNDPRVEVRKSCDVGSTQLLLVIRKNGKAVWNHTDIRLSMNGTSQLSFEEWEQLQQAVVEAREKLKES